MYEKEFIQTAEPKKERMEQSIEELNLFTAMDENMPSPEGVQSENMIILPEIQSMPAYIRQHYEGEIIRQCAQKIADAELIVAYEEKRFRNISRHESLDCEEEIALLDKDFSGEWEEPQNHHSVGGVFAADIRPTKGAITWMSFCRVAECCVEADLTIKMEISLRQLAAGSITADELYTSIAMIATAQMTTANIVNANIDWAQIENLAAEIATISKAQITTATINEANIDWAAITTLSAAVASIVKADIGTADVDWAHIKDLATDTAIITQGVGGELYIAKLAVTEANLVSLTVGELVVKGADGHFYSVSVDSSGNVVSTLKQMVNDDVADLSINAGEKIVEGSITAKTLNVQDIFADSAIIRSLIAAYLDVDTLFAREATIHALNAMDITGNEYLRLMVGGKADQTAVDDLNKRMSQAE